MRYLFCLFLGGDFPKGINWDSNFPYTNALYDYGYIYFGGIYGSNKMRNHEASSVRYSVCQYSPGTVLFYCLHHIRKLRLNFSGMEWFNWFVTLLSLLSWSGMFNRLEQEG